MTKEKTRQFGIQHHVRMLSNRPQSELSTVCSGADALLLTSRREGWPNVLLEAMACGTPVIAPNVGGVAEIVRCAEAGAVAPDRNPASFASAMREVVAHPANREATRQYAQQFGGDEIARAYCQLIRDFVAHADGPTFLQALHQPIRQQ